MYTHTCIEYNTYHNRHISTKNLKHIYDHMHIIICNYVGVIALYSCFIFTLSSIIQKHLAKLNTDRCTCMYIYLFDTQL